MVDRSPFPRLRCVLLTVPLLVSLGAASGCAVASAENRPLLRALDERLPDPKSPWAATGLQIAVLPVAIPAGLADTFVSSPALHLDDAARDSKSYLGAMSTDSPFLDSALLIPKLASLPLVFTGDWLWRSFVDP